jgi:hypothetical protein
LLPSSSGQRVITLIALIALMMEAARTSETLVNFYQTTRCYNREDSHLKDLGYGLEHCGLIPSRRGFFFSPQHTDWLWDPHSLLFIGYWASLHVDKVDRA